MPVEDLKQSQMMNHMLEALENGEDIGHYGRLTFAMVGVYFANDDELVQVMTNDEEADEREVRAMVQQVREKGYNPPNRDKILEWQQKQDSQICPNPTTQTPATFTASSICPRRSWRTYRSTAQKNKSPETLKFVALLPAGEGENTVDLVAPRSSPRTVAGQHG